MTAIEFNDQIGVAENTILAGDLGLGRSLLEKLADNFPKHPRISNNLGTIAHVQGNLAEALNYFRQARESDPTDCTYLLNYGDVLQAMGRWEEASEEYFKFLDGKPLEKEVVQALIVADEYIYDKLLASCEVIEGNFRKRDFSISVLVSTYASSDFIRECLEDLESQTIADQLEIIIVDAHSPQNEKSIVLEFQNRYDNIRYLRTPNRIGIYPAWNMAIRAAHGKYILPFSTNDRLSPNACQELFEAIEEVPEAALVYGDSYLTDLPHQKFGQHVPSTSCGGSFCWPEYNYEFLLMSCGIGAHPLWRRNVHATVGYFDPRYKAVSDQDFWLRLGQQFPMYHICVFTGLVWLTKDSLSGGSEASDEIYVIQANYAKAYRETKVRARLGKLDGEAKAERSELKVAHTDGQNVIAPRFLREKFRVTAMISVINIQGKIQERVQNILNQTFFKDGKMELILLDYGCSSAEQAILRASQAAHPNILYIRTSQEDPFVSWNRMVLASQGRYLIHIDARCSLSTAAIEFMERELDSRQVALVYADALITNDRTENFENHRSQFIWSYPDFNARQALLDYPFGNVVMWRRSLHSEIGLFQESFKIASNYEFFLKAALLGSAYHIPLPLCLQYEAKHNIPYGQSYDAKLEISRFLPDLRMATSMDVLYPFLKTDRSPQALGLAALDFGTLLLDQNGRVGYAEAEFFYRIALTKLGDLPEVINNLAYVLGFQGKKDEAGKLLLDAIQRFPALKDYLNLDGPFPQAKRLFSLEYPALQALPKIIFRVEQRLPLHKYGPVTLSIKNMETI